MRFEMECLFLVCLELNVAGDDSRKRLPSRLALFSATLRNRYKVAPANSQGHPYLLEYLRKFYFTLKYKTFGLQISLNDLGFSL